MEKLKLIYNPYSGNKTFKEKLDTCIIHLQKGGFEVSLFRTMQKGDIEEHLAAVGKDYDVILVSGGDGTVNIVINAMMRNSVDAALGIIPSGTANDFATHLGFSGLPISALCEIFSERNIAPTDLGLANDKYFINVCGGGLLTQVSQTVDPNLKDILGKMSYYMKGISTIPDFCPIPIKITNSYGVIAEDIFFFLVLNSPGAGSFTEIVKNANTHDGKLDFVAVKARPLNEIAKLFVNIIKGDHLDDPSIIYFKDSYIKIEVDVDDDRFKTSDVDGERGPDLPLEIRVLPNTLKLLTKRV